MAQLKAGTTIGGKLAETVEGAQAKADAAQAAAKAYADEAVAAHAGRKDNPHGVTKSQVGLGNVENYGIATQAEAEAGSVNNKYMTPLRVAQAIAALHANRRDNPHQVTAAQLGLGDVLTHLAQILGSRIVEHNLDVTTAPNGRYVRLDNGLQVCYGMRNFSNLDCRNQISTSGWYINSSTDGRITLPAQFRSLGDYEVIAVERPWWGIVPQEGLGVISVTRDSAGIFNVRVSRFGSGVIANTDVGWIAIGRWK